MLHTLVGYVEKPTGMQIIAYVATIVAMVGLMRFARAPRRKPSPSAA